MSLPQIIIYSATHNPELFMLVSYTVSIAVLFLVLHLYSWKVIT